MPSRTLTAADLGRTLTISTPELVAAADTTGRTLAGLVVPYGQPGNTSAGRLTVAAGAVQLPADLSRIKLVDEHQTPPVAIGYATEATETPAGLRMSFRVAGTPAGDTALADAAEGARDSFSVEMADVVTNDAGDTVTASRLTAVALVTVPAYSAALIDHIAASHTTTPEGTTTTMRLTAEERARLIELRAKQTLTQDEAAELAGLAAREEETDPADDTDPADQADQADPADQAAAGQAGQVAASLPNGLHGAPRRRTNTGRGRPIGELYAAMARVFSGVSRPELEAALSDITLTNNIWTMRDEYAGQLWSGLTYKRRFVQLFTPGKLTAPKGTGWRWKTKPEVDDYAGDKAAVPSNQPETEAVEWSASRLAGAHDIDRAFVDFNDAEYLAAYYAAMTESYAKQSDAKARAWALATAATNVAGAGATLFEAAVIAADQLEDNTDGAPPDYVLVNRTDRRALLTTTAKDVPAFLDAFGLEPRNFIAHADVPAGTVVVGTRQAGTFKELSDTPIRVETINIANGGVDGGVFGYYAEVPHHTGGIVSATFGAPAGE